MRLIPGIYAEDPSRPGPLGLQHGQRRRTMAPALYRAGWFNHRGEFLGAGDLSQADLIIVSERLERDELLVVMDNDKATNLLRARPGTPDLMREYARLVIAHRIIYYVDTLGNQPNATLNEIAPELPPAKRQWIDRTELWRLLQAYNALSPAS